MKFRHPQNQGNALIVTLVTIAVVSGLIGLAVDLTSGVSRNVQRSVLMRQAINIGDATTEMAFADWRAICISNSATAAPNASAFTAATLPSPVPGNFPGVARYALTNFAVIPLNSDWTPVPGAKAVPDKTMGPNPQNFSYYYLAQADVIIPTLTSNTNWASYNSNTNGNVVAHVRRILEKYRHNKTDKTIDYKDDLEIHPGPTFVVNGDVHTNGNLYTGHSTLTLNGTTSFSGTWGVGFKNDQSNGNQNYETTHDGETPGMPSWAAGLPPAQEQAEVPYGVDAADYHKLIETITDKNDPLYPFAFSNPANYTMKVTISDNPDPAKPDIVKVFLPDKKGNEAPADPQTTAAIQSALTTNESITDNREGATTGTSAIRVTTLDVSAITAMAADPRSKIDFSAPVLYITDTSAGPDGMTAKRAIRLKNGASLPSNGLTIASGNPVYIQGDYNTGSNGSNLPESDTNPDATNAPSSNPASPTVPGYDRKSVAVIADAVTVLSNAWGDLKSTNSAASNTTVNSAIITGVVPSVDGYYSGGAENFPRFLENWSGKTLTYYGSMIELYNSKQGIGHWGANNVYSPPNRAWYFDTNFLSNPPPGVPYDVDYRRSRWSMQ